VNTERESPARKGKQEVLLIRHGESTANASGVWQGQLDFSLSEEGRLQAAEAGRALKGTSISGIYASPLLRAFETAEIVAREAGFLGEVVPMPGLAERHGGVLEGYTWTEQEATNPEFAERFLSLPEEKRWAFAGAETDEEILVRFEEALSAILSSHSTPDGPLVVVSHGGVMRAFLREHFGPTVLPGDKRAPNASFTRIGYNASNPDAAPELLEVASTSHLMPEEERQAREQAPMRTE
jgi:broad specificity phosphatase PhoE